MNGTHPEEDWQKRCERTESALAASLARTRSAIRTMRTMVAFAVSPALHAENSMPSARGVCRLCSYTWQPGKEEWHASTCPIPTARAVLTACSTCGGKRTWFAPLLCSHCGGADLPAPTCPRRSHEYPCPACASGGGIREVLYQLAENAAKLVSRHLVSLAGNRKAETDALIDEALASLAARARVDDESLITDEESSL